MARGEQQKCATCFSLFKEMLGNDGKLVEGCEKCWKNNNYEGPVPHLVLDDDLRDMTKRASNHLKKLAVPDADKKENYIQNRFAVLDQRLELLKSKEPLKKALHALIRQISSHKMSEIELFNQIDQDGNGQLERSELMAAMRKLGVQLSSVELDSILRTIDQDGSGTIDYQEFYYLIKTEGDRLSGNDSREDDTERLLGFHLGQRVRVKVAMWTEKERQRKSQPDYNDDMRELGTVQGPGMRAGTLMVKLDRDELVNIKPRHLVALSAQELIAHPASCVCHACMSLLDTDVEVDDDDIDN
eukprot:TRINITY_DN10731_c0_g1_i1.p1 TRINITY_DN10731_c0_g1~~TRINITY_DN10731_c0_g1_i1.p1  ORF type:complete len:343 (-),score=68.00 TRINITY_DN10731_c0_g1_i1:95-994(-)